MPTSFPPPSTSKKKSLNQVVSRQVSFFKVFESIAYCTVVGNSLKKVSFYNTAKIVEDFGTLLPSIFGPFSKVYFQGL